MRHYDVITDGDRLVDLDSEGLPDLAQLPEEMTRLRGGREHDPVIGADGTGVVPYEAWRGVLDTGVPIPPIYRVDHCPDDLHYGDRPGSDRGLQPRRG
jgi:hypothetical protein